MLGYSKMFSNGCFANRAAAALVVLALVASACGASTKSTTASGTEVSGGTPLQIEDPVVSALPGVNVFDLSTGEQVNFASAASAEKTTLLWFWAPH